MPSSIDPIDSAMREVEQARNRVKRGTNRQVRNADDGRLPESDYLLLVSFTSGK